MLDLVLVTLVCWSLAAWLFWKWDIGSYRSDFQRRSKKKEIVLNFDDGRFPTPWRYE